MGVELIFRIAGIGVIVAIVMQVLKQTGRDEIGMLVGLAGLILVLMLVVNELVDAVFQPAHAVFTVLTSNTEETQKRYGMDVLKFVLLGAAAALMAVLLKNQRPELAMLLSLAACALLLMLALDTPMMWWGM